MPLVTFHMGPEISSEQRDAIAAATQRALVSSIGAPEGDLFQRIHQHAEGELIADPSWGGVERQNVLYVDILMVRSMYDDDQVRVMFETIADALVEQGVRRDDVFISVSANGGSDWYAGA